MNAYSSKLDTFLAMDMYNLPLPVLPPADLTLSQTLFTNKFFANRQSTFSPVIGFETNDNPFLRSFGFFSNLADGLVDAMATHQLGGVPAKRGFIFGLQAYRYGAALTGTIANVAGSAAIVGTATLFTEELAPGMTFTWYDDGNNVRSGVILSITDNTHLTLTAVTDNTVASMFRGVATTTATAFPQITTAGGTLKVEVPTLNALYPMDFFIADVSKIRPIRGKVTVPTAGIAGAAKVRMTGIGTKFTEDVVAGQWIRYPSGGGNVTVRVFSVDTDTQLTLYVAAAGVAGVPVTCNNITLDDVDSMLTISVDLLADLDFYTISIDPAYGNGTRRLSFHAVAQIEHTFTLTKQFG